MDRDSVCVLIVEDDEDDYVLVSGLLGQVSSARYLVRRASDFDGAVLELERNQFDVVLLDYHLGAKSGLDVLKHIGGMTASPPAILLTGNVDYYVDLEAMKCGAADYIDKSQLSSQVLERCIRYSLEREKAKNLLIQNRLELVRVQRALTERVDYLGQRERYFRSILANMHEDIFVIGPDRRICDVNRPFVETIKRKRRQIVGRPCYQVLRKANRPCFLDGMRCLMEEVFQTGKPASENGELVRADGERVSVKVLFSPLRDEAGKVVKCILAVRDIAHELRLESELRQAQKMKAIGTLAGGIAHDFNNILGIILGYAELTHFQLPPDTPESSNLIQIQDACLRGKEVVRQILAFSRKSKHEKRPVPIGSILTEALKLLRPALPATVEIKLNVNIPTGADLVLADATQMLQVIMNLSSNAADAMSHHGGTLEIDLDDISVTSSDLADFPELTAGSYVCISFRDSGCGMEPSDMERIFDPYFSTKGLGRGTGLGLAVVHGIVKEHKGQVKVYSEPGKGSVFKVYLPEINVISPAVEQHTNESAASFGTENILMIDDEKNLVDAYSKLLNNLGYHTVAKVDSLQALETFRNSPKDFDLVITDQTMPKMTGLNLAKQILQIRPDIPIIICSGRDDSLNEHSARQAGIRAFLTKPVLMKDLSEKVRELLGERSLRKG